MEAMHHQAARATTRQGQGATSAPGCSDRMQDRPVLLLQHGSPLQHHQFRAKLTASDLFNPERDRDYF